MKSGQAKVLRIAAVAVPLLIIVLGASLQTFTLIHAQKMAHVQRQLIVYIQASRLATFLNEAGSGMGAFSMTHLPLYAERFNKANEAIPDAVEELGNLGPFEGEEAEAISQLKQCASESIALMARAQAALASPDERTDMHHQGVQLYRSMKDLGERIRNCVQRLAPEGGTNAFLRQGKEMENETGFLRMLTVVWLVNSLLGLAVLTYVIRQSGLLKST